jgi:hypothetical protein
MEKQQGIRPGTILEKHIHGPTAQSARAQARAALSANIAGTIGYLSVFTGASSIGDSIVYESAAKIGIGTTDPGAQLHVYGRGLFCAFALDCGAAAGKILWAIDSFGNALWSDPPTGGGTIDGIGTTNKVAKWSDSDTLTDSLITDTGTAVTIGGGSSGLFNVQRNHATAAAIYGENQNATLTGVGVYGLSANASGAGVEGLSTGATGYGVKGSGNLGVYGSTTTGTGTTGTATSGTGVYGVATTGRAGHFYRNSTGTTEAVLAAEQANSGDAENAFEATNAGSSTGAGAIRAITTGGGVALYGESTTHAAGFVYRAGSAPTSPLLRIWEDHASANQSAVDIRQDGLGDIINGNNAGVERFTVGVSGNTEVTAVAGVTALKVYTPDTSGTEACLHLQQDQSWPIIYIDGGSGTAGHGAQFITRRSRGTIASPGAVVSGDQLGAFMWRGYANSAFQQRAGMIVYVDGTVSGSTVPTRIEFHTGTSALTEAMRIDSAQNIGVGTAATAGARVHAKIGSATLPAMIADQTSTGAIQEWKDNGTTVASVLDGGTFYTNGCGVRLSARTISANDTGLVTDHVIFWASSTATGNRTYTLPPPTAGRELIFIDSQNNATARTLTLGRNAAEQIDGAGANKVVLNLNGESVFVYSDGTNWFTQVSVRA